MGIKRLPDDYECDGQIDLMDYIPRSNRYTPADKHPCDGCKCYLGPDNVWCEHAQRGDCPLEDGECKGLKPHKWPLCDYYRKECLYYKPNSLHLEECLNAVLVCYDDGTKLCPQIDSWGCEECMKIWERRHKDD